MLKLCIREHQGIAIHSKNCIGQLYFCQASSETSNSIVMLREDPLSKLLVTTVYFYKLLTSFPHDVIHSLGFSWVCFDIIVLLNILYRKYFQNVSVSMCVCVSVCKCGQIS